MTLRPPAAITVLDLLVGLFVGLASGVAIVALHQSWPWLLTGLAAAVVAVWWWRGAAGLGLALGWGVPVWRGALRRPEGDYLVAANGTGWVLLLGSALVLVTALATLRAGVPPGVGDGEDQGDPPTAA